MGTTVFATVSTPGPAGPQGPAGYSPQFIVAAGAPAAGVGNNGDMYINSATGDVYGPKVSGAWGGIVCNIKGSTGATGATGPAGYSPQYIVAPGVPAGTVGNNGDMYINSTTSDVYGPKTSGAWGGIVCNIKGATGAQGPPGVGYTPKGAWSSTTTYTQGDQATYNNVLYISLQTPNLNNTPSSSPSYWQNVASGGSLWTPGTGGAIYFNTGYVGIGTSGPGYLLDVRNATGASAVHVSGTGNDDGAYLTAYSASGIALTSGVAFNGSNWIAKTTTPALIATVGNSIQFISVTSATVGSAVTLPAATMTVVGSSVGIGLTNPGYPLDVLGANPLRLRQTASGTALIVGMSDAGGQNNLQWFKDATPSLAASIGIGSPTAAYGLTGDLFFSTFNGSAWTDRMRITNAGNVGIGTTAPQTTLTVYSAANHPYNDNLGLMQLQQNNNAAFRLCMGMDSNLNSAYIQATNSGGAWLPVLVNPAGGNVGIGTATPQNNLHVAGTGNCFIEMESSASAGCALVGKRGSQIWWTGVGINGDNNWSVYNQTATQFLITATTTGNVGIGTTNPGLKLSVAGSIAVDSGTDVVLQFLISGVVKWAWYYDSGGGGLGAYNYSQSNFAMYIAPTGRVGVGTTTPLNLFTAHTGTDQNLGIRYDSGIGMIGFGTFNDAGTAPIPLAFNASVHCFASGNVGIGTASPYDPLFVVGAVGLGSGPGNSSRYRMVVAADQTSLQIGYWVGGAWYGVGGMFLSFNGTLGIGRVPTSGYYLDVAGDCNITGTYRVNGAPIATGGGPTTQNVVTGSRALGGVYGNSTGKALYVCVIGNGTNGSTIEAQCDTSSSNPTQIVAMNSNGGGTSANFSVTFVVVPGNYYKVTMPSGGTMQVWIEWN